MNPSELLTASFIKVASAVQPAPKPVPVPQPAAAPAPQPAAPAPQPAAPVPARPPQATSWTDVERTAAQDKGQAPAAQPAPAPAAKKPMPVVNPYRRTRGPHSKITDLEIKEDVLKNTRADRIYKQMLLSGRWRKTPGVPRSMMYSSLYDPYLEKDPTYQREGR